MTARKGLILVFTTACIAFLSPPLAQGGVRRVVPQRRPYIVEIGQPYEINMDTVRQEAGHISEMKRYLAQYGYPDYAEIQEIEPKWPWESYEVRLYYMRRDLETDFGHVFISPAMPGFGVMKYKGYIPPDKRHEIAVILQARVAPPPPAAPVKRVAKATVVSKTKPKTKKQPATHGLTEALVARIEAAANRAQKAADSAAEASNAAASAANRTLNIVDKMEQSEVQ